MANFDKVRIYNRVPAREWGPLDQYSSAEDYIVNRGVVGSILNYYQSSDNYAQKLVDEANNIINNRKYHVRSEDDDALAYLAHEDAKDVYLGMPQRTGLISKSEYFPTITKNKSQKQPYYKFNHQTPEYWESVVNDMKHSNIDFLQKKQYVDKTLNKFTASRGNDPKKGEYISIYDIWDYNWAVTGGGSDNIAKHIPGAKPFEIYDRVYLDDLYKVNSSPKKGDYYGGYLPEITITPKKLKGGIIGLGNIIGIS